jgi:hypothetical protein
MNQVRRQSDTYYGKGTTPSKPRQSKYFPNTFSQTKANKLSKKQLQDYFRDGFTREPLTLFDNGQDIQNVYKEIMDYFPKDVDIGIYNQQHKSSKMLWEIAHNKHLVEVMQQVYGPNIIITNVRIFTKNKSQKLVNKTKVPLHQDLTYYEHEPKKLSAVWLAITDVTLENSPVQFLPGSHKKGEYAHKFIDPSNTTNGLYKSLDHIDYQEQLVPVTMKAGQFTIHDGWVIHGSSAGISDRTGLQILFTTPDVKLKLEKVPYVSEMEEKCECSLVCGVDEYGYNSKIKLPPQGEVEPIQKRNALSTQYLPLWINMRKQNE